MAIKSGDERAVRTRACILAAAERVFAEKGLAGARVDEIAEMAAVNKRMLYAHFGGKEALYKAALEQAYLRLGECEEIVTRRGDEIGAAESIRAIVSAYFAFLSENDSYVRMVMWENLHRAKYFDEKGLGGVRDPMRRAMGELLRRGKGEGIFRADASEEQLLMTLFSTTFNYFSNIHTMSRVMKRDLAAPEAMGARIDAISDMILRDIAVKNDESD